MRSEGGDAPPQRSKLQPGFGGHSESATVSVVKRLSQNIDIQMRLNLNNCIQGTQPVIRSPWLTQAPCQSVDHQRSPISIGLMSRLSGRHLIDLYKTSRYSRSLATTTHPVLKYRLFTILNQPLLRGFDTAPE